MTPKAGFGEDRLVLKDLPKNLLQFQRMFTDEKACGGYLWRVRWPNGFVCSHCGGVGAWKRRIGHCFGPADSVGYCRRRLGSDGTF
jgi:hypothetical protein